MEATSQLQSGSVSVLVPVLNEADHLAEALAGMRRQQNCDAEFLVIDGGSTDATWEIAEAIAEQDPRVRLLRNPAGRTPNALNVGLQAARGEFVARMDAHCLYPETYLAEGIERLRQGGVAWVSGPQLPIGRGKWSERVAVALETKLGVGGATFREDLQTELEVDSGFTGIWRRDLLLELGGWDEGWPVNQDGELAARIREDGGRIVCLPKMAAGYIPRNSLASLRRQYWRYGQYKAKTCRHHPNSMRRSHLLAPGVVVNAAAALLLRGRSAWPFRLGLGVYCMAVAATAWARRERSPSDRLGIAAVLVTMHGAWGLGFLTGSARFGPPVRALARVAESILKKGPEPPDPAGLGPRESELPTSPPRSNRRR